MEELSLLLKKSRFTVALTGAGVSTFSGLPDFRGKTGLYQNPEYLSIFDLGKFKKDPKFYYSMTKDLLYKDQDLSASIVHQALARLEKKLGLKAIITQNIDRLHQAAGSGRVVEVHGSGEFHNCLNCNAEFAWKDIAQRVQSGEIPPLCECGGFIKPAITFFGENLPEKAFREARQLVSSCDLLIIMGTSLTVEPVASLPQLALNGGAKIIVVNDTATWVDSQAVLKISDLEAFSALLLAN